MRIFELLIIVSLTTGLVLRFLPFRKRMSWFNYLPSISILLILIHLFFEGYRWQMVPAFIVAAAFFILILKQLLLKEVEELSKGKRVFGIVCTSFSLLGLIISTALLVLMPVTDLPEPGGDYLVGTKSFRLSDSDRPETFTDDPKDNRELLIKVWYPAVPKDGSVKNSYWEDTHLVGSLIARGIRMPSFLFDHVKYISTNSYANAPLSSAEDSYPVLIFSHGYLTTISSNTILMEELASQGYIIFSIGHSYQNIVSIYPDGKVVPYNEEHVALASKLEDEKKISLFQEFIDCTDKTKKKVLYSQYITKHFIAESFDIWVDDTLFVMDELERLNQTDPDFSGKLDLSRLGLLGHSLGGAVASRISLLDNRCKAGINMDGIQFRDIKEDDISSGAFMFMYSGGRNSMNSILYDNFIKSTYSATITDSKHMDYTDFPYIFPLSKLLGFSGSVDGKMMTDITNQYVFSFFNKHLNGTDEPLLEGASKEYQNVKFNIIN